MLTAPVGSSSLVPESETVELVPEPDSTGSLEDTPLSIPFRRSSHPVTSDSTFNHCSHNYKQMERRASDSSTTGGNSEPPPPICHANADWSIEASSMSHIFVPTSSSSDSCYLNTDCKKFGHRSKCVSCRIVVHDACMESLNAKFFCKQTFRECVRKYREQTSVDHHWVQRKNLKGKCKHCGKAFQSKLGFGSVVGVSCSWCKFSYHNKDNCLNQMHQDKDCDLGTHSNVIVPPSWIVKLPRKGSFKSSLKNSPKKSSGTKLNLLEETQKSNINNNNSGKPFCVKPIPSPKLTPILVFLNPKSGGNQGAKLMQKFQWLLNPRQVFDLTQGGPQPAIEMFRKVPNIKLLACGGDGTVGWLLSVLDKIEVDSTATVGVLPLGTGNDLSRSLGWGGGYIDEPISKILNGLQTATEVKMDRWILKVERNADYPSTDKGEDKLPLNVVNNYFSLGVDAQIALQFHEAREANPSKFNSRIRNKMFYGQAGGKDLLLRKWKDLSHEIEVECDGKDITPKLREHRVHSVLFANIPSFGSGTRPWNRGNGEQRIDDGLIEVMGLTTYQLPLLQAGGHATCITQCKTATIKTRKTIPMQVDGEASRLNPATITLSYLNQVSMLAKIKGDSKKGTLSSSNEIALKLSVSRISMPDYESFHYDKDRLKELAQSFGEISTTTNADLEAVRNLINKVMENNKPVSSDWCFIDSVTAIRFFRIDRAQENLHYVTDICDEELHILEMDSPSLNDDEKHIMETAIKPATPPPSQSENEAHHHNNSNDHHLSPAENSSSSSNKVPSPSKSLSPSRVVVPSGAEAMDIELAPPIPTAIPTPLPPPMLEKTTEGVLKAARLGDIKMLTDLFNENYSLLSIDETGKTALHYGARFGHKEIIKFLISKAPPSILDMVDNEKGQTALHKAAGYKRRTICCMLVAAGSSLSIHDQAGLTPRQLAVMAEDHDLSSYLESQEHFQNEQDIDLETPV
ncbi:eye-specific diacylglycerol kinase [Lepeophtheirus salmonis]|uniref:eye-specific diacylglycerol kinase n=1 Tax=Lepeophtheirus salmonis TaxID=72036 RepID=UPI001AE10F02|nr:eye-specific diacylglycerol kinase-like [Lepeophtheirus salmonis]XP_040570135.1 eye-specific diacylglycerol kinase-like [Lepeophtheirus salmonis]